MNYNNLINSYFSSLGPWTTSHCISKSEILSFQKSKGFILPQEFIDFYIQFNGVGLARPGEKVEWIFVPIEDIPAFAENHLKWMRPHHPDLASKFFPFINFLDSGDCFGYLFDEDQKALPGLYVFEHECYIPVKNCPVTEFLICYLSGIEDFLKVV